MTDLKVFKSTEFGELGVMTVNGKEYFPATQCAKLLGHKNPQEAIRLKCKGVRKILTPTVGGSQEVNYIPEGDLYRLIVSSKLPAAEKFESWVFDEVLPSIRQTGGYGQSADIERIISQTAAAVAAEFMKHMGQIRSNSPSVPKMKKAKRHICSQPMKMELLPPEVKKQADDMIASGEYSCQQIANYIANTTGEYISQVAVNRYRRKFFELEGESGQLSMF